MENLSQGITVKTARSILLAKNSTIGQPKRKYNIHFIKKKMEYLTEKLADN
jgi:hypothetical protein